MAEFDEHMRRELVNELQPPSSTWHRPSVSTATAVETLVQAFVKNCDQPPGNVSRAHYEHLVRRLAARSALHPTNPAPSGRVRFIYDPRPGYVFSRKTYEHRLDDR